MSDKELIKQEIERQLFGGLYSIDAKATLENLYTFIDSMPEEPASEDLEEEMKTWIPSHIEGGDEYLRAVSIQWSEIVACHFAEWQKQQMKETLQTEYEKGRFDMREEMMKMAEDTAGLSLSWTKDSKTKIIIIEEGQQ